MGAAHAAHAAHERNYQLKTVVTSHLKIHTTTNQRKAIVQMKHKRATKKLRVPMKRF
jgi:hypothetical protein